MDLGRALDLEIISLYAHNLKKRYSIHQIAQSLNKAYPYINKKVSDLIKEGIFIKTVVGRSHLCSLNLENQKTRLLLTICHMQKSEEFCQKQNFDIAKILKALQPHTLPHAIVASDSTIYIVCEHKEEVQAKSGRLQIISMGREEFQDKSSSILTNHTILYGYERFYELVNKEEILPVVIA